MVTLFISSLLSFLFVVYAALKVRVAMYAGDGMALGHIIVGAASAGLAVLCATWAYSVVSGL